MAPDLSPPQPTKQLSLRALQAGRFKPLVHVRCGFCHSDPFHKQFSSHSCRDNLGCFSKALRFFREPLFEAFFVLDAATLLHAILHPCAAEAGARMRFASPMDAGLPQRWQHASPVTEGPTVH